MARLNAKSTLKSSIVKSILTSWTFGELASLAQSPVTYLLQHPSGLFAAKIVYLRLHIQPRRSHPAFSSSVLCFITSHLSSLAGSGVPQTQDPIKPMHLRVHRAYASHRTNAQRPRILEGSSCDWDLTLRADGVETCGFRH